MRILCYFFPVQLVDVEDHVLVVSVYGDDAHWHWHLDRVLGVTGCHHELRQRRSAQDPVVWQGYLGDVEGDLFFPEVELVSKHHS